MRDRQIDRKDMTADQTECMDMLSDLVGGDHHITGNVYEFGRGIRASVFSGRLSTFDFNMLTHLVLMAHDRCIRAEIIASAPGRIGIALHKRHARDGSNTKRHPTIEEAIDSYQRTYWTYPEWRD